MGAAITFRDITERKRAELPLAFGFDRGIFQRRYSLSYARWLGRVVQRSGCEYGMVTAHAIWKAAAGNAVPA